MIGNSGWLLPEKPEAKKEAEMIAKVLSLPAVEKKEIRKNARQRVELLFSEEISCEKFMSLINKAAGTVHK